MPEVVVVAVLKVRPGQEESARQLVTSLVLPTHAEPGCILYAVNSSEDGSVLNFVERWESSELLDTHLASAHITAFGANANTAFLSIDVYRMEAVPIGEAAKGSLAGHAGAHGSA